MESPTRDKKRHTNNKSGAEVPLTGAQMHLNCLKNYATRFAPLTNPDM